MSAESAPSVRTLPRLAVPPGRVRYNAVEREVVERSKAMRIAALARRAKEIADAIGTTPENVSFDLRVTISGRKVSVFE